MTKTVRSAYATIPPAATISPVDSAVNAFRRRWQSGDVPRLLDFLRSSAATIQLDDDSRRRLVWQLIALDLEYRWRGVLTAPDTAQEIVEPATTAAPPQLEDYYDVLASVSDGPVHWPAELILHEMRLRQRCGDAVTPAEYLERFPQSPELADLLFATQRPDSATSLFDGQSTLPPLNSDLWKEISTATDRAGDYQLLREVARGGMGVVYEAQQLRLNRIVAVKMILDSRLASNEARRRFLSEAQAAARLHHPNIVSVFEVGQFRGQPFFSMAFVDGKSLSAHVAKEGPLPPMEAAQLTREIAEGVEYAHQQGIVHRDLKPQNVLLTSTRQPMITDFGLAKQVDSGDGLTLDGQVMGTPGYMAPEQARGQLDLVDARSDVYSLGAILYFVMTGRAPFHSSSPAETLRQLLEQDPVPPRRLNPEIGVDLETICLKCLQKDHTRRYVSARALIDDLERFANGFPILARPISRGQRLWRACRRHPATAMLAVAVVLLLLVGVPAGVWYQGQLATERANARAAEADQLAAEAGQQAAERIADASQRSVAAAREIAATQEYFANLHEAQQLATSRRLGWRKQALARLERAAALEVSAANHLELRNEAAACLLGVDIEPAAELAHGPQSATVAFSPDGKWLAAGQFKAHFQLTALGFQCGVTIVEVATGKVLHTLEFAVQPLIRPQSRDVVQDGCRVLRFSPDGRWLACGTRSGQVNIWDMQQSPPTLASWNGHATEIHSLAFSADSTNLFTAATDDCDMKKWSFNVTEGWKVMGQSRLPYAITAVDLDADRANLLVSQTGSWFAEIDAASLDIRSNREVVGNGTMGGTPWPSQVLAEASGDLGILDLPSSRRSRPFVNSENGPQSLGGLWHLECSPDGAFALTVTKSDRKLRLWDMASRRLLAIVPMGTDVFPASFAPDSRQIALIANNRVVLYRIVGGTLQQMPRSKYQSPAEFAWIENGAAVAAAEHAALPLAAMRPNKAGDAEMLAAAEPVLGFQLSGDGRWAAVQLDADQLAIWRVDQQPPQHVRTVAAPNLRSYRFSRDHQQLWAIADSSQVLMWNVATGERRTWFDHSLGKIIAGRGDLRSLAPTSKDLLIGSGGGRVFISDGDHEPDQHWNLGTGEVNSLAVSPDDAVALCGTLTGAVQLLSLAGDTEPVPLASHADEVLTVAFSPDGGLLASGSRDRTVRLWRRQGSQVQELVTLRFDGVVAQIQFRPDGTALGVRIQDESAVRVVPLDDLNASFAELTLQWPQ